MTPIEAIRRNFHQLIDTIEDDKSLADLYTASALYLEQQHLLLDTADEVLLARMKTSLSQAERGEVISNEAMKEQVRQWLGK